MISGAKGQRKSAEQFADIKKEQSPLRYICNSEYISQFYRNCSSFFYPDRSLKFIVYSYPSP